MARRVRVNADNVQLPDGGHYNTNDEVTLTDEQFDQLSPTALGDEVTDLGPVAETGDEVIAQAAMVAAPAALTSAAAAASPPTKAEFDALQADVAAMHTTLTDTLAALKVAGGPMAAS